MRALTPAERGLNRPIQPALFKPGTPGTGRRPPRPGETRRRRHEEAERQWAIVKALRRFGYLVKETSEHRRPVRCECGNLFTPAGGSGIDRGIGDLLISRRDWGGIWLMLECKADEKAPVRPEQRALRDTGYLWVCWTVQMALDAVAAFEERHSLMGRGL